MNKTTALETLKEFPNEFSLDELFEKLMFIEKVEDGIRDADAGKTFTSAQTRKRLKKWLK